jgi:hypothetical protein
MALTWPLVETMSSRPSLSASRKATPNPRSRLVATVRPTWLAHGPRGPPRIPEHTLGDAQETIVLLKSRRKTVAPSFRAQPPRGLVEHRRRNKTDCIYTGRGWAVARAAASTSP